MRSGKRISIAACIALAAIVAMTGAARAQQPIVIKFSHVVAQGTPKGKGAEKFNELLGDFVSCGGILVFAQEQKRVAYLTLCCAPAFDLPLCHFSLPGRP